jgi:aquaporin Z
MRNYITEFIGTFFLVLTIGLTVIAELPVAPLAIGSILMVMVYMGGHISGAHYNPAITLAVYLRGLIPAGEAIGYVLVQTGAALAAALVVLALTDATFAPLPGPDAGVAEALLAEYLFTLALGLVVLNVATARETTGNSFFGLAIGFTVAAGAFAAGSVSGAAFNPAVAIGPSLVHALVSDGPLASLWIYLIAPLAAGATAAFLFRLQHPEPAWKPVVPPPGPSFEAQPQGERP